MIRQAASQAALYIPGETRADYVRSARHRAPAAFRCFGVLLLLLAALPIVASAQTDPLSPSYVPPMDCNSADYPANIALSGPLVKLRQDASSPSAVAGSSPCVTVHLFANEIQSYQVHVQAPSGGYSGLTITLSDLVKSTGPGGNFTISHSSTSPYYMIPYTEDYMDLTISSSSGYAYYNASANPGYYPDRLVPFVDPYYNQTTNASPVAVAAGKNQSFWVDVHVPSNAPAGYYLGSVTVSNAGTTIATLPVLYAVWQYPASAGGYLPSTPTLAYSGGFSYGNGGSLCQYYGTGGWTCTGYPGGTNGVSSDAQIQALDNKLSFGSASQYPDTGSFSGFFSQEGPILTGNTSLGTYHVQPFLAGAKETNFSPQCGGGCSTSSGAIFNNWAKNFQANGLQSVLAYSDGTFDEPSGTSGFAALCSLAAAVHAANTYFIVPTWSTTDIANINTYGAQNCVDGIIVNNMEMWPHGGPSQLSTYSTWLSGSCCGTGSPQRYIGKYISCAPDCGAGYSYNYPSVDIDGTPANNRVMEWLSWKEGAKEEIYYAEDLCWFNSCGYPHGSSTNACTSIYEYGNWGDGDRWYPGVGGAAKASDPCYVGPNVTTPIFCPSIRIKMARDGMQDYQYLSYLSSLGGKYATLAQTEYSSWVSNEESYNVNPTAPATNSSGTYTGDVTDARYALGEAIHQITYPAITSPTLSGTVN
jgi:hypothetical protein